MAAERRNWTREETILAFELYCRTPFSKISKTNKDVIELAGIIGRTPSSVGLKMANLAHYDPELLSKNVSGMVHGSKMDKAVWDEFSNNWEELSYQAKVILSQKKGDSIREILLSDGIDIQPGYDSYQMTKTRVGQYFFRSTVLSSYSNRCCITGLNRSELLIASHIKPWNVSDEKTERTNPQNGLCLNALHDKAFDRGLMTIDSKYQIVLSDKIKDSAIKYKVMVYELFWERDNASR